MNDATQQRDSCKYRFFIYQDNSIYLIISRLLRDVNMSYSHCVNPQRWLSNSYHSMALCKTISHRLVILRQTAWISFLCLILSVVEETNDPPRVKTLSNTLFTWHDNFIFNICLAFLYHYNSHGSRFKLWIVIVFSDWLYTRVAYLICHSFYHNLKEDD